MSLADYHRSTTDELLALTNKVRSLINHWGEEGRYKEAVLKNIIRKFIPSKFSLASGFVIKQTDQRGTHLSSTQIDLLIYDDASPVLFREGDFVILTADSVRAIIEVKANIQNQGLERVIAKANETGAFIFSGKRDTNQLFFNGIFGYDGYGRGLKEELLRQQFMNANAPFEVDLEFKKYKVNHIALNKDYFVKYWPEDMKPHSVYNIPNLAFSFFISNLVDTLASKSVDPNKFIWYADDKELTKLFHF